MSISILRATPADLAGLLLLMSHMQLDDPWDQPPDESVVRRNLLELLQNPNYGFAYIARDKQSAFAYVIICFDFSLEYRGKGAWIDELFVAPSHRGKGIASQLLDRAEQVSLGHGAQTLHLEVTHGNPAIEIDRRRGFVDHNRYLMTKWLKPPT